MDHLSTQETADRLGKSNKTILRWLDRGAFPGASKLGRYWRIPVARVDEIEREGLDFDALEKEAA